jgi:hypothetical protein
MEELMILEKYNPEVLKNALETNVSDVKAGDYLKFTLDYAGNEFHKVYKVVDVDDSKSDDDKVFLGLQKDSSVLTIGKWVKNNSVVQNSIPSMSYTSTLPEEVLVHGDNVVYSYSFLPDHKEQLNLFKKNLSKLIEKGSRVGFDVSYTEEDIVTSPRYRFIDDAVQGVYNYIVTTHKVITVTTPKKVALNGDWELISVVDVTMSSPVFKCVPNEEVPQHLLESKDLSYCEHCGHKRRRNETLIIRNNEGKYMVLGKSCAKDYLGENALSILNTRDKIQEFFKNDDDYYYSGEAYDLYKPVREIIALSSLFTREGKGYKKTGDFGEWGTKDEIIEYYTRTSSNSINNNPEYYKEYLQDLNNRFQKDNPTEVDYKAADRTIELIKDLEGNSSWVINLKSLIENDSVHEKYIGVLASSIILYGKEQQKKAKEQENKNKNTVYYGELKERFSNVEATFTNHRVYDGVYGTTHYLTFEAPKDSDSNYLFIWKTGSFNPSTEGISIGDKVMIEKATVKDHSEWNGLHQTYISRAKIQKI